MKFLATLLLSTLLSYGFSQSIDVQLSGMLFGSEEDSVYLAQFYGDRYVDFQQAQLSEDGTFEIKATLPAPDYYVIRVGKRHVNVILRNNSDIKVYGDAKTMPEHVNFVGSKESHNMNEYVNLLRDWTEKKDSAVRLMQEKPEERKAISQSMSGEYNRFKALHQNFISQNQNSAALFPVISAIDIKNEFASYESVINQLNLSFGNSKTVKLLTQQLEEHKKERFANDKLAPGKLAPDFEEKLRDGSTMKLSDLKGQVVLLDFWASWCGPCRRENPNVVNLYNKYKDDGFTVMSVSLDKMQKNWEAAIEKDGLIWPHHVSDLKHWQSKAARLYGVKGIPFTVLIDKEGRIIQTKLRGPALEQELARIFGH